MRRAIAVVLLGLAALAARAEEAPPVDVFAERSDHYDVSWKGMGVGRGTISLTRLDAGCYRYQSTTRPAALVRWLYGTPRETSEFCLVDGQVQPRHFEYVIDGRSKDNFTLDFDWSRHEVKTIKGADVTVRELKGPAYDRFVLQLVIRQWVARHADEPGRTEQIFTMVDDRQIRDYRFAITGHEQLVSATGAIDTVRVDRTDNPDKISRFWVLPDRSFIPARIEQIEKGKQKVLMELQR